MSLNKEDSKKVGYKAKIEWYKKRFVEVTSGKVAEEPTSFMQTTSTPDELIGILNDLQKKSLKLDERIDAMSNLLKIPIDQEKQPDIAEAERLTAEAAGPLGVEAARTAEQTALGLGQRMGRGLDASTLARAALGRESAQRLRRQEAAGARQRALVSAGQARIDPFQFMFGAPSAEELMTSSFLSQALGPQVTDPGQAITLGSAEDLRKAQAILGEGQAIAQGTAASGAILGQTISGLGSTLGSMNFGGGATSMQTPMTPGYGTVLAPPSGGYAQSAGQNLLKSFGF